MKKIKYIIGVALATMLIACSSDYEHYVLETPEIPIIPEIVAETIPLSDALDEMFSVFELLPVPEGRLRSTRSAMEERMSVTTIYAHHTGISTRFATRGTSNGDEDEDVPLLYVVNFEEGGFSILSASTHTPATVLAISNESNFNPTLFLTPNHPFTPCEDLCPDFQFFNAYENDYYVANTGGCDSVIAELILEYMQIMQTNNLCPINRPMLPCDRGGSGVVVIPPWQITRQIGPLLHTNVTSWHQRYPFNTAAPIRGIWPFRKQAPVGCVPLALAQIITFNEFPNWSSWNEHTASWSEIQSFWHSNPGASSTNAGLAIATMLRGIGIGVFAIYTRNWTFALPINAGNFLSLMGYQNVQVRRTYYEDGILNMLRNNKPVFVAAVSGITNGHAWVIDGYMIRERGTVRQTLVHCVFGWGGRSNGWYESGIFNASRGALIPNNTHNQTPGSSNWNSNNWIFRTITYSVP